MLSIPLFINFFPNSVPIAFDPRSNLALIRFEPSPTSNTLNKKILIDS